jgi:hypothetical protein
MMRSLLIVGSVVVLGAGVAAGWFAARETQEAETTTTTTTETETPDTGSGLPAAVEETRAALLEAAESGSYEALRQHIPSDGFTYSFGGPIEGGPIPYWQQLERETDERPLEILGEILRMPYVLSRGIYVWPWAYTVESAADLSEHERELLAPLGPPSRLVVEGTGYIGWRAGITPDGSWVFFVAGD